MSEVDRQNGFLFPGCECSHLCPGDCDPEECACGWYNARIAALTDELDAARERLAVVARDKAFGTEENQRLREQLAIAERRVFALETAARALECAEGTNDFADQGEDYFDRQGHAALARILAEPQLEEQ